MRAIELDERASTGALGQVMGMRDGALPTPPEPDDGTNEMALAMATAAAAVLVTGLRRVVNRWQTASTPAEQASAQAEMDVQFETLAAEMRNMELKAAVQADYIAQLEAAVQRGNERAAQAAPTAAGGPPREGGGAHGSRPAGHRAGAAAGGVAPDGARIAAGVRKRRGVGLITKG